MSDWRDRVNDHYHELSLASSLCRMFGMSADPLTVLHWIDADPEQIRASGKRIGKIGSRHEEIADQLRKGLGSVDAYWTGVSAQTFVIEYVPRLESKVRSMAKRCFTQRSIANQVADLIEGTQEKVFGGLLEAIGVAGGAVALGAALAGPTAGASLVLGVIAGAVSLAIGLVIMLKNQLSMLFDLSGKEKFPGVGPVQFDLAKLSTDTGWKVDSDPE